MMKLFSLRNTFFLLCLFFFIVFCLLGNWQLHRYYQKKELLVHDTHDEIEVDGYYANKWIMILQNQVHNGEMGYDVLTPFKILGQKRALLVDRGWVKQTDNPVLTVKGSQHIEGYVKAVDKHQFILGKNILEPGKTPLVMQKVDIAELSRITNETFYPFVLRLNPSQPNGFVRDWPKTEIIPERHLGYAIQWFLLAVVVLVGCFFLRRGEKKC